MQNLMAQKPRSYVEGQYYEFVFGKEGYRMFMFFYVLWTVYHYLMEIKSVVIFRKI